MPNDNRSETGPTERIPLFDLFKWHDIEIIKYIENPFFLSLGKK